MKSHFHIVGTGCKNLAAKNSSPLSLSLSLSLSQNSEKGHFRTTLIWLFFSSGTPQGHKDHIWPSQGHLRATAKKASFFSGPRQGHSDTCCFLLRATPGPYGPNMALSGPH